MSRMTIPTGVNIPGVHEKIGTMIRALDPDASMDIGSMAKFEARQDFKAYMELMFPGYVDGWHLDLLRDALTRVAFGRCKRLIITIPPRHSKSMHVSEGFPGWYLGQHQDHRIIAVSHTQKLANKFSLRVLQRFADPNWPFDGVTISSDRGGVEQWDIEASPTGGYMATGVGGRPAGMGADLIIIDDPIGSQADADSALVRESLWEWFNGTLYTRRQPGAAIILTATRWHEDDLTGRLLARMKEGGEVWEELHLPAEDDQGNFLWPDFWSPDEYEKAKLSNDMVWLAQYQGRPSKKGGNMLREEWFPNVIPGERYIEIIQSWDCAEEPGESNDYSVCTTIGVTTSGYDILHIWRDQVEFPDLEEAAKSQANWVMAAYPGIPYTMVVEPKSAGKQLIQVLHRDTRLPVVESEYPNEKDGKRQRVIRNTVIAKARRIRVALEASWRVDFFREMKGFPREAHDDIVDSVMIGIDYANGLSGSAIETVDYIERQSKPVVVPRGRRPPPPTPAY